MSNARNAEAQARTRFIMLSLLRFIAAAAILFGIVLAFDKLSAVPHEIGQPMGYALVGVGLIDLLLVIPFLARRWRSKTDG